MSLITTPEAAARLARAIASDLLLYNNDKVRAADLSLAPFARVTSELTDGFELFTSRVAPVLPVVSLYVDATVSVFEATLHVRHPAGSDAWKRQLYDLLQRAPEGHAAQTETVSRAAPEGWTPAMAPPSVVRVRAHNGLDDGALEFTADGFGFTPDRGLQGRETYAWRDLREFSVARAQLGFRVQIQAGYTVRTYALGAPELRTMLEQISRAVTA